MNSVEFKELQEQFADIIIKYDHFSKVGFMLDLQYNLQFADLLDESFRLDKENELIQSVLLMVSGGKSNVEIETYIISYKKIYNDEVARMHKKRAKASEIFKRIKDVTQDQLDELDEKYADYIKNHHPSLKLNATDNDVFAYQQLKNLYFESNLITFKSMLDILSSSKNVEINENEYNKANVYYNKIIKDIVEDIKNKKDKYPYNIKHILENDMTILHEEAELKYRNDTLKTANEALHKDYINIMHNDVKL